MAWYKIPPLLIMAASFCTALYIIARPDWARRFTLDAADQWKGQQLTRPAAVLEHLARASDTAIRLFGVFAAAMITLTALFVVFLVD